MSLAHHFVTMAYNNAWSNHRLLAACSELTGDEFVAPRTSFFPSIKATYNHVLTVDWYYVDALERSLASQPVNPTARSYFDPEEPFERCADLSREQHAVDRRLVALCVALGESDLERTVQILRANGVAEDSVTRILAHLFQHQIHHRGQVHAMLAGTRVPPPQLDEFFCKGDAHLREKELAELGSSEEAIWG
jgi:uncharacterized damage-inducible protein DinB